MGRSEEASFPDLTHFLLYPLFPHLPVGGLCPGPPGNHTWQQQSLHQPPAPLTTPQLKALPTRPSVPRLRPELLTGSTPRPQVLSVPEACLFCFSTRITLDTSLKKNACIFPPAYQTETERKKLHMTEIRSEGLLRTLPASAMSESLLIVWVKFLQIFPICNDSIFLYKKHHTIHAVL